VKRLDDYLKIADAAEYLGISQNTLRKWADDGRLAVHRNPMNGYRLFKIKDLEKLLREIERSGQQRPQPKRRTR